MRTGILSDESIRNNNPAFFNLPMNKRQHLAPSFMQKHIFTGNPTTHQKVHYRGGRPLNDFNNFANFSKDYHKSYNSAISNINNISVDKNLHQQKNMNEIDLVELKPFLSAQMRRTIKKISEGEERVKLLQDIIPTATSKKLEDSEVLSKLNKMYRDDVEQLEVIERAYHEAGNEIALA